jgi:hypothetical protein
VHRVSRVCQANSRHRQEMWRALNAFLARTRRINRVLHALGAVNARQSPAQRRPERSPMGMEITLSTPTVSGYFLLRLPASPFRNSSQKKATTMCMFISVH